MAPHVNDVTLKARKLHHTQGRNLAATRRVAQLVARRIVNLTGQLSKLSPELQRLAASIPF